MTPSGTRPTAQVSGEILEIRIGKRTYRTRPVPFNWQDGKDGDVRLFEDALRQACPHAAIAELVNRTRWESETAA